MNLPAPPTDELGQLVDQIVELYRFGLRDGCRDDRKHKRYPLQTRVLVRVGPEDNDEFVTQLVGQSVDMSLLGLGVVTPFALDLGSMVTATFDLPSHPPRRVKMLAQVRNAVLEANGNYVLGLEFHQTLSAATTGKPAPQA